MALELKLFDLFSYLVLCYFFAEGITSDVKNHVTENWGRAYWKCNINSGDWAVAISTWYQSAIFVEPHNIILIFERHMKGKKKETNTVAPDSMSSIRSMHAAKGPKKWICLIKRTKIWLKNNWNIGIIQTDGLTIPKWAMKINVQHHWMYIQFKFSNVLKFWFLVI